MEPPPGRPAWPVGLAAGEPPPPPAAAPAEPLQEIKVIEASLEKQRQTIADLVAEVKQLKGPFAAPAQPQAGPAQPAPAVAGPPPPAPFAGAFAAPVTLEPQGPVAQWSLPEPALARQ